jgi:membrane protein DedA with SNARE-associated domain
LYRLTAMLLSSPTLDIVTPRDLGGAILISEIITAMRVRVPTIAGRLSDPYHKYICIPIHTSFLIYVSVLSTAWWNHTEWPSRDDIEVIFRKG